MKTLWWRIAAFVKRKLKNYNTAAKEENVFKSFSNTYIKFTST